MDKDEGGGSDIEDLFETFYEETKPEIQCVSKEDDSDVQIIDESDRKKESPKSKKKRHKKLHDAINENSNKLDSTIELDSSVDDKSTKLQDVPYFIVKFRNDDIYRKYGTRIEQFLQTLTTEKEFASSSDKISVNQPDLKIFGSFSLDADKQFKAAKAFTYETDFNIALATENEEELRTPETKKNKLTCFNCLGAHNLKDCTVKKDHRAIRENKLEFMKNKSSSVKSNRYHVELDEECMGGNFVPGQISDRLRDALGTRPDELPLYIYQMRVLGYPPGWLEEARIESSGISLIEGNDDDAFSETMSRYDFNKVHSYPGFNVFPPSGTLDKAHSMGYPPIMPHHLKVNWQEQLEGLGSKEKKKNDNRKAQKRFSGKVASLNETPVSSKKMALSVDDADQSLSLVDLEEKRRQLLEELDDDKTASPSMGTPVLNSVSPYLKLPEISKFSSNITDHIPFENLPGYTGTYKRIGKLLKRMRKRKMES